MYGLAPNGVTPYSGIYILITTPVTSKYIKYWDGSAWVAKPLKYWNGSAWVEKPIKYHNGSTWV